jgi:hypothetical protein
MQAQFQPEVYKHSRRVAQAFDLAGIKVGCPVPSRFWRRAGTMTSYATEFVQNGQQLSRKHRLPIQLSGSRPVPAQADFREALVDCSVDRPEEELLASARTACKTSSMASTSLLTVSVASG